MKEAVPIGYVQVAQAASCRDWYPGNGFFMNLPSDLHIIA